MGEFINYTVNGALIGLMYALVAMSFVVVYRASKVFNLALGELVVVGGFLVWLMATRLDLPLIISLPIAFLCAAIFGFLIERIFFSRMAGESVFAMIMVTIGLMILLRGVVLVTFGAQVRPFPAVFPVFPVISGDFLIPQAMLYGGGITVLVALGLAWFFNRTRAGLRMTAVAEDHQVAMSLGISVRRSVIIAWIMGSMLATLGAIVFLSNKSISFTTSEIGLLALPVALLAGLESIAGLILAGIIIGIVQGLASGYLDPALGASVSSVLPFVIMLLILFVRPTGMFGWKTIERV